MKSFAEVLKELKHDGRTEKTIRSYKNVYEQYERFLNGKKPTIDNAEEFIKTKENLSPASIHNYRMALRTYFKYNNIEIPKGRLKGLKVNNVREDKYVTRKEVDELYKAADSLRDKVIVRLLFHAGLRAGELVRLNVGDLDLKNQRINVKGEKRSHKVRSVRLIRPELVIPTIRAYLKQRGIDADNPSYKDKKQPLVLNKFGTKRVNYTTIHRVIKELGKVIGKEDLSPHWLRHGFVVWNKEHGVPAEICAIQIGDTYETTVKIYSHFSQSDVDRIYDQIHGYSEDEKKFKNPIDEIEELKEINKDLERRINKLEQKIELLTKLTTLEEEVLKLKEKIK